MRYAFPPYACCASFPVIPKAGTYGRHGSPASPGRRGKSAPSRVQLCKAFFWIARSCAIRVFPAQPGYLREPSPAVLPVSSVGRAFAGRNCPRRPPLNGQVLNFGGTSMVQEAQMEPRLVVALFHSSGIAEDARNRLKTEGVPGNEIALRVLKPRGPIPPMSQTTSKPCRWIRWSGAMCGRRLQVLSATVRLRFLSARPMTSRSNSPPIHCANTRRSRSMSFRSQRGPELVRALSEHH